MEDERSSNRNYFLRAQSGQGSRSSIRRSYLPPSWDSAAGVMGSRIRRGARFGEQDVQNLPNFMALPLSRPPDLLSSNPTTMHCNTRAPWPAASLPLLVAHTPTYAARCAIWLWVSAS